MSRIEGVPLRWRPVVASCAVALALGVVILGLATRAGMRELPETLRVQEEGASRAQVVDRGGQPLTRTFDNEWNLHDSVPLHDAPQLLRRAFVEAEDRRFFAHHGVDWQARLHAVFQNLRARRAVRGASTISEQVVRMLHPRSRTLWSRWLEGFEAGQLESRFSKGEILEFYLNQVPYARRRRGVVQAARDYFDRDLETLNETEQLALVVLVRSPSRLDLRRSPDAVRPRLERLAASLRDSGELDQEAFEWVKQSSLELAEGGLEVSAPHFVQYARGRTEARRTESGRGRSESPVRLTTTVDAGLQSRVQKILETQIETLSERLVGDGAALVVDHQTDEILAWVNAGRFDAESEGSQIDAVVTRRQPGSTLKPFVYALALERGWTAATVIEDAPFKRPVGRGQHAFRNYSRRFYGPVRLRAALGNSLNIPAVRAAAYVTPAALLERLQELGFASLDRHPDFYGEGLALGNGEVTLLELVSAYAVLARGGIYRPLRWNLDEAASGPQRRVFDPEVSSLIADILSDPEARRLEFSANGILSFPYPTAVKTGTSNDYRDAWAMGFSDRYTVGVWMGNLDLKEMQGISGAKGPAVVLRGIFSELARGREPQRLFLSPHLQRTEICAETGDRPGLGCPIASEWFRPGHLPVEVCRRHAHPSADSLEFTLVADRVREPSAAPGDPPFWRLEQPTPGLDLALDPRIPDEMEAFPFEVSGAGVFRRIEWLVDGVRVAETGPDERRYLWPLARGRHEAQARIWTAEGGPFETAPVAYYVK